MTKGSDKHIIVKYIDHETANDIKEEVKNKLNIKLVNTVDKKHHSKLELLEFHDDDDLDAIIEMFHNHSGTCYAQKNHKLYPYDENSYFKKQWGLYNDGAVDEVGNKGVAGVDINVLPAWEITKGVESTLVAVIDTGIDINHIDLKDNIYDYSDIKNNEDLKKWDFAEDDPDDFTSVKEASHGTMTTGIIAAEGKSGTFGVAPKATILPLKFMSSVHGLTSDAIEAIEYAEKSGAKIVNCSWGSNDDNPALLHHIQNSSMLFVCAAGNDGEDLAKNPNYPASFDLPNVISVAAVNNMGELWSLSNFGQNVHIAAPGTFIFSTIPSKTEDSYSMNSGTSFAAPFVSGVAALLLSVDPTLSAKDLKNIILSSSKPLDALKGKVTTSGIVDAAAAMQMVKK